MEMARNYVIKLCVPMSIVISFLFLSCAASYPRKNETGGKAATISTAPTRSELENATYSGFEGIEEIKGPVRLIDGKWEGPAYTRDSAVRPVLNLLGDFIITGDLDGDGSDDSVTVLNLSTGGTGQLLYIAVVSRISGAVRNVGTKFIGDRVQIRGGRINKRSIFLDVVRAGPSDAACCPGEIATIGWTLEPGGMLAPVIVTDKPGRLSLQTIAATEWVLRKWTWNEAAPADPAITIQFRDGQFVGSGGCNRYFAPAKEGGMSGDVSTGPIGATRMSCNEQTMAAEQRYFAQLSGIKKFGFMLGRLALTYETEGRLEVMLFEERNPRAQ